MPNFLSFFIGLPATIGLLMVHRPLVAVILQGDAFTPEDTSRTGLILLGYASALWAYCITHVLVRAFYARGEAMTAVTGGFAGLRHRAAPTWCVLPAYSRAVTGSTTGSVIGEVSRGVECSRTAQVSRAAWGPVF